MRRTIRLLAAAGAATLAVAAPAAADAPKHETYVAVRTTDAPATFTFSAEVPTETSASSVGFFGYVGARYADGKVTGAFPGEHLSYGHSDEPGLYAAGESATLCDAGQCGISRSRGAEKVFTISDDGGTDEANVYFIVVEGERAKLNEFTGTGWVLRKLPFGYRYVDGTQSTAVAAEEATAGVEVFVEATAPGGAGGSLGQAQPPCGLTADLVWLGAGLLTLEGGAAEEAPQVGCPNAGHAVVADRAPAATTWTLSGVAAGHTLNTQTRLFVVDLPQGDPTRPAPPEDPPPPPPDDEEEEPPPPPDDEEEPPPPPPADEDDADETTPPGDDTTKTNNETTTTTSSNTSNKSEERAPTPPPADPPPAPPVVATPLPAPPAFAPPARVSAAPRAKTTRKAKAKAKAKPKRCAKTRAGRKSARRAACRTTRRARR